SHAYADNGTYTATATGTDDDGGAGSNNKTASSSNASPVVTARPFSGADRPSRTASAGCSDPATGATHTCTINWGDGNTAAGTISESNGSSTCSGSHAYRDNANYTVTVTVVDDDGGVGSNSKTASIANANPVLTASVSPTSTY